MPTQCLEIISFFFFFLSLEMIDRLPLVAVGCDAGAPAAGGGRRPGGARRGEAPGERPRHVEVEQDAVAAAAEAAPADAPAVPPPRRRPPLGPPHRRRRRLLLPAGRRSRGARVLPLCRRRGRSFGFAAVAPAPGLLDEVGERELVLGLGKVVQHPQHLLPPPRDLLRPRRSRVHGRPRARPGHPQQARRGRRPLRARLQHAYSSVGLGPSHGDSSCHLDGPGCRCPFVRPPRARPSSTTPTIERAERERMVAGRRVEVEAWSLGFGRCSLDVAVAAAI